MGLNNVVILLGKIAGQEIFTTNSSLPVGPAMKNEIPGVESMTRVNPIARGSGVIFKNGEKKCFEKPIKLIFPRCPSFPTEYTEVKS